MTLEPFVREAIDALRYLQPAACAAVAEAMERLVGLHANEIGAAIRKEGAQLSADEKNMLRLDSDDFMSQTALDMLTAKGRRNPIEAFDTTILRANFAQLRERNITFVEQHEGYFLKAFGVVSGCPGCEHFNRREMTAEQARKLLPPKSCLNEACGMALMVWQDFFVG